MIQVPFSSHHSLLSGAAHFPQFVNFPTTKSVCTWQFHPANTWNLVLASDKMFCSNVDSNFVVSSGPAAQTQYFYAQDPYARCMNWRLLLMSPPRIVDSLPATQLSHTKVPVASIQLLVLSTVPLPSQGCLLRHLELIHFPLHLPASRKSCHSMMLVSVFQSWASRLDLPIWASGNQ